MYICPICNKDHNTLRQISKHIQSNHNVNAKDILFEAYPELFRCCGNCGIRIKQYASDSQSGKFCGKKCLTEWMSNRKQSPETIAKRIANTNQEKKEQNRQKTMIEKYGELHYFPDTDNRSQKISDALRGSKHTQEHHKLVIESKRENGKLNHTQETKEKISKSLLAYWSDDSIEHPSTIPHNGCGGRNHLHGIYNGIYYRSSYELRFLELCNVHNIIVETASTKEFRIRYEINGKRKYYYPDFYLPDYDVVVEIKPSSMLNYDNNMEKINAGCLNYNFWVVTEEELEEHNFIDGVNNFEYIFLRSKP